MSNLLSTNEIYHDPGSYKDPSGYVFYHNNEVYRYICDNEFSFFEKFIESEIFIELCAKEKIVNTRIVQVENCPELSKIFSNKVTKILQHDRIKHISYPYEWSLSMCIDAALLTLEIQEELLRSNYSLKDATPYNIQFQNGKPIFIDIASIETVSKTGIWTAYNQFCQFWLYPILIYRKGFIDLKSIYLSNIDGIKFDDITKLLGSWPFWKFGLTIDYLLPFILSKSKHVQDKMNSGITAKKQPNSPEIQLSTVKRCKRIVQNLANYKSQSNWTEYVDTCSYSKELEGKKVKVIDDFLDQEKLKTLLDIGCNTGIYSELAAKKGVDVVAVDSDQHCINRLYESACGEQNNITPLFIDITNPSPAIGWNNNERQSFLNRFGSKFDCVLSLALVHHVVVTKRIPLDFFAKLLSRLTKQYIITEFVGTDDSMFQQLTKYRTESYDYFDLEYFRKIHDTYFEIIEELNLTDKDSKMERSIFIMRKK